MIPKQQNTIMRLLKIIIMRLLTIITSIYNTVTPTPVGFSHRKTRKDLKFLIKRNLGMMSNRQNLQLLLIFIISQTMQ